MTEMLLHFEDHFKRKLVGQDFETDMAEFAFFYSLVFFKLILHTGGVLLVLSLEKEDYCWVLSYYEGFYVYESP